MVNTTWQLPTDVNSKAVYRRLKRLQEFVSLVIEPLAQKTMVGLPLQLIQEKAAHSLRQEIVYVTVTSTDTFF